MSLQMTSKIEKLKYLSDKNFHSLDEITKLLIEIVEDLDAEIKELKLKPKVVKEEPITIKPKKKRKWL